MQPITGDPHGEYIATSTGTKAGKVWETPSALNSTGDGFSVVLP